MFRGCDEHKELCWSNLIFSTVESGNLQVNSKLKLFLYSTKIAKSQ